MLRLRTKLAHFTKVTTDIVAVPLFEDEAILRRQTKRLAASLKSIGHVFPAKAFTGKEREVLLLHPEELKHRRLLLFGLGKLEKLSTEQLRRAAAQAAKAAESLKAASLTIVEPDIEALKFHELGNHQEAVATALAEGAALGVYRFDKYLTEKGTENSKLKEVVILAEDGERKKEFARGVEFARIVIEATYVARDLANAPGNEIFPGSLAERTRRLGRKAGFSVSVFDEKKIRQLKMGGLLGVAQGSAKPPRFIVMEHRGTHKRSPTVVLIGKGVTFDSGGISIKPSANMGEMKMDMSGAAAVIGTLLAMARLKHPMRVVGLVPATENLPSGTALKPGDILTHYNGKTSEIDNTDAEGRLILADALSFAGRYKPDLVIDLATLTGAVVVALGHVATGMLGNDEHAMVQLKASGERTYERVWQLPMFEEYEKLVKSDIADVKNTGGRWGGAITAAMFLKKFIGDEKWVHLDIAGTAILEEATDYTPKGGSGMGVRLLVDFLRTWKPQRQR